MDKIIFALLVAICIGGNAVGQTPDFICITEKHTIQVNKVDAATYRYRSWNKPKTTDLKPDMDLKSKDISVSGSGVCRHYEYSFKTGKVEFLLDDNKTCVEGKPPANIIGNLSVLINDELKNHYYCFKQ